MGNDCCSSRENKSVTIALLGNTTVGKSKLIEQYVHGTYDDNEPYVPTELIAWKGLVCQKFQKLESNKMKNKTIDLEICDTSGDKEFDPG